MAPSGENAALLEKTLDSGGIAARVVSMPSWELFAAEPPAYRDSVLPPRVVARVSLEAGTTFGWERHVGRGARASASTASERPRPGRWVMREYGFTPAHVVETVRTVLAGIRGRPDASRL